MAETNLDQARRHQAEFAVDMAVHAAGLFAALIGAIILLTMVARTSGAAFAASAAYVAGLLTMLASSAVYNWGRSGPSRDALHRLDQSAIFLMIAGSYTPFTSLHLASPWSVWLTVGIWIVAGAGVLLRLFAPLSFERLYLLLYVGLGWIGLVAFRPLNEALPGSVMLTLVIGGCLYTLGVTFHLSRRLPFQNAIWHAFVVTAASVHFAAVVMSL